MQRPNSPSPKNNNLRRSMLLWGLAAGALGAAGCGGDDMQNMQKGNPFAPVPECQGPTVAYGQGTRTLVISNLEIASPTEGFDLDGDGKIDNKLGVVASLAGDSLDQTFTRAHNVVIPMEFFGPTSGDADCTKFALYLGQFNKDRDKDGADTNWDFDTNHAKGDCNDQDPKVGPGQKEIPGNFIDDDCDGLADNDKQRQPGTDKVDHDGDGVSMAEGDCDDRADSPLISTDAGMVPLAKLRHPALMSKNITAAAERCDGIDYNCDGIPDNAPACDPFGDANVKIDIQKVSLNSMQQPLLAFRSGKLKQNALTAGPDVFRVTIPFMKDALLDLELSGARIRGTLRQAGDHTYLDDAVLGGVLEAVSLARIDKVNAKGFITPPQSLFDAVWAGGVLNQVLNLKTDAKMHVLPDMDVDGDGLETFWASDPNKVPALVDTCQDGDGTIIKNGDTQFPNDDPQKRCVYAKDDKGRYRFVDGISAALKFRAVPARLGDLVDTTLTK